MSVPNYITIQPIGLDLSLKLKGQCHGVARGKVWRSAQSASSSWEHECLYRPGDTDGFGQAFNLTAGRSHNGSIVDLHDQGPEQ